MKASLVDRDSVERLLIIVGAIKAGLIDALASGEALSAQHIAMVAGADARASGIVLEALAVEGIVTRVMEAEGGSFYALTPLGKSHLVDEGPERERSVLLHRANRVKGLLDLAEIIRTGQPSKRDPNAGDMRCMVSAMGERDAGVVKEIVDVCLSLAGEPKTMLDVGGAVGHVARQFMWRGLKATLMDKEEVLPIAREYLGIDASSIDMVSGDFTVALPRGPFDLVYFGNVYHIYGPSTNQKITRDAISVIAPGGLLVIQDHVHGRSLGAELFAVNMLQATSEGGVWTEAQYRAWLSDAGFVNIDVLDLENSIAQLIVGQRPGGPEA